MNIPGFTAEASLYNGNARYQATAEANFYGGIVQPAQSDVFDPDRPIPHLCSWGYGCRWILISTDRFTGIPHFDYRCGVMWVC